MEVRVTVVLGPISPDIAASQSSIIRMGMRESLRTASRAKSPEEQAAFFRRVTEDACSRYWSFTVDNASVGYGGLLDINWEAGYAEISLMCALDIRAQIVAAIMDEAFGTLGLNHVYGEVYECADWEWWRSWFGHSLWENQSRFVPGRKFWMGRLWGAHIFWMDRERWLG